MASEQERADAEASREEATGQPPHMGDYWAARIGGAVRAEQVPSEPGVWDRARRLSQELADRYRGQRLEDVYPVQVTTTGEGPCVKLRSQATGITPDLPDPEAARARLCQALELVWGVGAWRAARYRQAGFDTVDDLCRHETVRAHAAPVAAALAGDPVEVYRCVRRRTPPSHPLLWCSAALFRPEDWLFFDIETLGLSGVAVILVGVGEWSGGALELTQYLATSVADEPAVLAAFAAHAGTKRALVSFNGRTFDGPVLAGRAAYYGITWDLQAMPHYDLLPPVRRLWRSRLPDCQAATVEREVLGVTRADDLPGSFVPPFYEAYQRDGEIGPLAYIVEHNRWDLSGMAQMFLKISNLAAGRDVS